MVPFREFREKSSAERFHEQQVLIEFCNQERVCQSFKTCPVVPAFTDIGTYLDMTANLYVLATTREQTDLIRFFVAPAHLLGKCVFVVRFSSIVSVESSCRV